MRPGTVLSVRLVLRAAPSTLALATGLIQAIRQATAQLLPAYRLAAGLCGHKVTPKPEARQVVLTAAARAAGQADPGGRPGPGD